MAQRNRHARPGTWHHVFNRGLGKRLVFDTAADHRKFLALLACVVRAGLIEVHAFCLLGTHFHLLVWIPREGGDLSRAMMRVQNAYVRWFNRRNRRDGPLFRGRFGSKPVDTSSYWLVLLRYIDLNPVTARICEHPAAYEHSSSRHYFSGTGPKWLHRRHAAWVMEQLHGEPDPIRGYRRLIGEPLSAAERELVDARADGRVGPDPDPLDGLLRGSSRETQAWMIRKARNADGLAPSLPLVPTSTVLEVLQTHQEAAPDATIRARRKHVSQWPVLRAGLLHLLCGVGCELIARRDGCTNGTISRRVRTHRAVLQRSRDYAELAAEITREALDETYRSVQRPANGEQKNQSR